MNRPVALILAALLLPGDSARAEEASRLPWHGKGQWLSGDIHIHNLLDRKHRMPIIDAAAAARLDFIACTEHAEHVFHRHPKTRTAQLREKYPGLILLAGIEWNMPGAGHASVVVERSWREWLLLEHFAKRFDRLYRFSRLKQPANDDDDDEGEDGTSGEFSDSQLALRWLREKQRRGGPRTVVYLNHPSRGRYVSDEQIAELQAAGLDGIEAGPGHQLWDPPGSPDTIDGYEPYVAVVGGGYDRLLARGRNLGLAAGSDFHWTETSYLPGEFSRTLVYAPERSASGVLRGLAAGSTVTVMGGIVRSVETLTSYEGLRDPAQIGEVLEVPGTAAVKYRVELDIAELDFQGQANRVDRLEIISDCLGPPAVVQTFEPAGTGRAAFEYTLPAGAGPRPGACFLRARGRKIVDGPGYGLLEADLLFYTGATRLRFGP